MTEICQYQDRYKNQVIQIILQIQQQEYHLPITSDDQPDLASIETFYQQDDGNFWVDLDGDIVVGTIALKNIGGKNAVLRKMFVRNEFRGKDKGVSNRLLSQLLNWARDKGFKKIFLGTTPQFLAAHKFYEKNGFKEIDKNALPINFPIMDVDKKFYCYSFE